MFRISLLTLLFLLLISLSPNRHVAHSQSNRPNEQTIHVVQVGENLFRIARFYNVSTRELADANNLVNVNLIFVGQSLVIPVDVAIAEPTDAPPTATASSVDTPIPPTVTPVSPTATPTDTPITSPIVDPAFSSPWTDPAQLIEAFSPVPQSSYHSPFEIIGLSRTFESTVSMRLVDENGLVLTERFAMGGGADGYDFFQTYMRFFVNEPTNATLELFQSAGEDDDLAVDLSIPLTLLPGQRAIDLIAPEVNATICGPINVAGYSLTFEGNVPVTLAERNGSQLSLVPATGGGTSYRDWGLTLDSVVAETPRALLLSVHESSARDGSIIDMTRIPISLYPAGHPNCNS